MGTRNSETLGFISLSSSVITILVLPFVKYKDTSIVKANNLILSYILLICLVFCFLCSLLYIGHPNQATCILQQTIFRVLFTVAASTVLAKTITVVIAFKLLEEWWERDAGIGGILFGHSPLYPDPNCSVWNLVGNVSSLYWQRYTIWTWEDCHYLQQRLSYCLPCCPGILGFLGSGSFTVAFLARDLPDRFNEAKFLTFTMLVFCSVWITFLPAYHSTRGKIMVAVEVFSILASSAGLLGCIFVPKCYVIFS